MDERRKQFLLDMINLVKSKSVTDEDLKSSVIKIITRASTKTLIKIAELLIEIDE